MSIKLQQEGVPGNWVVRGTLTGISFNVPSAIVEQFSPFDQDILNDLAQMLASIYRQGAIAGKEKGLQSIKQQLLDIAGDL